MREPSMSKGKCAVCKHSERDLSWQPFGPDESPLSFVRLGSHYRGFPVVPLCGFCQREKIEAGDEIQFKYKEVEYVFKLGMTVPVALSLWDGGETDGGVMICRDTPKGHDVVAVVAPDLVDAFTKAPKLVRKHAALRSALDEARQKLQHYDPETARRLLAVLMKNA